MKRMCGSHLRWQRIVEFEKAIAKARATGERVEAVTPDGIAVLVEVPTNIILEQEEP